MTLRLFPILAAALVLPACQPVSETTLSGAIQGTTYHIKVVLDELPLTEEQLKADVEAVFRNVDEKLSNWREDSEISRFNQRKTADWQTVSPEIIHLIAIAREVHAKTGGCYDLTVKPLFELWGFAKHEERIPTAEDIARARTHVGMDKLELDAIGGRLRKADPELQVSLDSIAQGYTVGAVADKLEQRGIQNYLAEIGGEMKVKGHKANGDPWRVAIEKPTPMTRQVQRILDLSEAAGAAVMTSGTYRNFFESGGKTYSHILDPRTGNPVTHNLLSATVLHPDPTWADAWSTGLLCVGEVEGPRIAEAERLKALFISHEGEQLRERSSSALEGKAAP